MTSVVTHSVLSMSRVEQPLPGQCGTQARKSPDADSSNSLEQHSSPSIVLALNQTSPYQRSSDGGETPTSGNPAVSDELATGGVATFEGAHFPQYLVGPKQEPDGSPPEFGGVDGSGTLGYERTTSYHHPDALLEYNPAASVNNPACSDHTDTLPSANRTHEYIKSLSMQAYGTQAPATACLQPNMYNHYMYGATHGGRGQQRSSCLSAQNYLNSYSGAMQSHSPYMAATYGYGGVAAAPAGPSHPLTSSPIAQQSSFNSQQSRCSDLQSIVDYSSFPTGYPSTAQSFYYSHTPASTAGGANTFPAAAGSYQSAAAAVVAAAASGGSMAGSTAGGLVGGAAAHCLSAAPVPVSSQTYHLSPLPPISTSDGSEFSESGTFQYHSPTSLTSGRRRRNSNGTSSSRRRRRGDPSPDQEMTNKIDRIFIWDLDETIIVFHSLLTGQYARENDRNPAVCSQIGSALETLVFTIGEELFFLKDLDVESQYPTHVTNIDDLHTEDNNQDLSNYNFLADGLASTLGLPVAPLGYNLARNNVSADIARKIAFRHRRVKELYSLYRNCIADLFRNHMHGRHPSFEQSWTKTRQDLESETNGWLSQAISCLKLIQERKQCTNVMVTRNMLMTTFAKTVAFSLADCFEPENIFSAYKVGFESCLNSIRQKYTERYGREVICIVVGKPDKPDSPSIITAARQFGMPYFPINSDKDLHALQFFLQYGYM